MKRLGVTVRLGAGVNTVEVGGQLFDRIPMDGPKKRTTRRIVVEAFRVKNGFPEERPSRASKPAKQRKAPNGKRR